jgi:putative transposase
MTEPNSHQHQPNADDADDSNAPHSHSLRLHRSQKGCFFVTKTIQPRKPILDEFCRTLICSTWIHYASAGRIRLAAFVAMPDHFHVLLEPSGRSNSITGQMCDAGRWIHGKTGTRLATFGCSWQEGFHETRVRSSKQFQRIRDYIHYNPVKSGLVKAVEQWPWSSKNPDYGEFLTLPWPERFEQDE